MYNIFTEILYLMIHCYHTFLSFFKCVFKTSLEIFVTGALLLLNQTSENTQWPFHLTAFFLPWVWIILSCLFVCLIIFIENWTFSIMHCGSSGFWFFFKFHWHLLLLLFVCLLILAKLVCFPLCYMTVEFLNIHILFLSLTP